MLLLLGGWGYVTGNRQCGPGDVAVLEKGRVGGGEKVDVMATDGTSMGSTMPPRNALLYERTPSGNDRATTTICSAAMSSAFVLNPSCANRP